MPDSSSEIDRTSHRPHPLKLTDPDAPHAMLGAWLVLIAGFIVSFWAWHAIREDIDEKAQAQFAFRVEEALTAIRARMLAYEQVLRGAIGLFEASQEVERHEWRAYVNAVGIGDNYPGIQGIGFSQYIAPRELAAHIEAVRAQGFADYAIRPSGERTEYTSIVFIEPFDERNRRAFGYDMFSEPVRRAAMQKARDNAESVVSGKVVLVQESNQNVQAGVLLYLPVYRRDTELASVDQRRAALLGFVYGAFRMNDLMDGILGWHDDIAIEIYDGIKTTPGALLYQTGGRDAHRDPVFSDARLMFIEGSLWALSFASRPGFEAAIDRQKPATALAVGVVISLSLFAAMWAFATSRLRALRLARDMTAALRKSEERSRQIVDTAHEAFVAIDSGGKVVDWNREAEATLGWPRADAIGREFAELSIPPGMRDAHRQGMRRFAETGVGPLLGRRIELPALHRDGHEFQVEITVSSIADGDGFAFNAFLHDISERARSRQEIEMLNADLAARAAQLEASNKELESFSYSVSHDLRSPLRAVDGFSRIMQEEYEDKLDDEGKRILAVIREGSQKMGHLIDDLLAFSRFGRQPINAAAVDMAELAGEAYRDLHAERPELRFELAAMPQAWGDRSLLKQVWVNLLANAIKFAGKQAPPVVEAGGTNSGEETVYHVKDNGVGFDMRYYDKLFGVFQRLHPASEFPGTGVGLAIVQRVVSRHGGRVWAESVVGQGAIFYFALPVGVSYA